MEDSGCGFFFSDERIPEEEKENLVEVQPCSFDDLDREFEAFSQVNPSNKSTEHIVQDKLILVERMNSYVGTHLVFLHNLKRPLEKKTILEPTVITLPSSIIRQNYFPRKNIFSIKYEEPQIKEKECNFFNIKIYFII